MNVLSKFCTRIIASIALVVVATGCMSVPKRPAIFSAAIVPSDLKPGDSAIMTVEVRDKFGLIQRVEGIVKEDPTVVFELQDDGIAPDERAGDGIWSLQVDVPFNAPPGDFEVTVNAYNAGGEPILITNDEGEVSPLMASFGLIIRFPPD